MSAELGARESCSPRAQQASCGPASQPAHGASRRTLRVGLAAHYARTARICPVPALDACRVLVVSRQPRRRPVALAQAGEAWFHEEYEPIADLLDELGIGGPRTDATRYLRIVVLRNRLMDDPSWTDDVTERVLEAIRTNAPDSTKSSTGSQGDAPTPSAWRLRGLLGRAGQRCRNGPI